MPRPLAYDQKNALNAICPYFTMFPLEYPLKALKKHRKDNPVVMDPFCGRGTTLFAARSLGLQAWGVDSSPVAVAVAKAKMATATTEDVINLAEQLIKTTTPLDIPSTDFFQVAYHPEVLRQLCALREGLFALKTDSDATALLRAAILGCLHGPLASSVENSSYFSNQMPRTFGPKPGYSVRYWEKNGLKAPNIDVLQVLRRKLNRIEIPKHNIDNRVAAVIEGDSQLIETFPEQSKDFAIVVTSPPYYGMRTYVQDQWLRNWFLGGPANVDYKAGPQLNHGGQVTFSESLGKVWRNMAASRSDSLHMYIRFGVIPSASVDAKQILLNSLDASQGSWRVVSVRKANAADAGKRQAMQMQASSQAVVEYDFHVERIEHK